MKIQKITVENYRLLKDFSIDLENDLSLVIGKNNTGKTSLLSVLGKFLNQSDKISFDDFNLDFKEELRGLVESEITEEDYQSKGIRLKLFIEYSEGDDLSNISRVMMDLNPDNNFIVLSFEYVLIFDELKKIKSDFDIYKKKKKDVRADDVTKSMDFFLKQNYADYFKNFEKSLEYNLELHSENDKKFIDLKKEKISLKDLIRFESISAQRNVTNREADKTLSLQTSQIYKKIEAGKDHEEAIDLFKDRIVSTDLALSEIYLELFKEVVEKVKKYGGIKKNDSIINIVSTLQHKELLDGNTTVTYKHGEHVLPEGYNGLGYMNLISIIFEIEILLKKFRRDKDEKPSDINLLFIEEPEVHTHPQMQYVFINNIKKLINDGLKREDGESIDLQCIISTHSSHIVSESDFDDIKYLKKKEAENCIISKNLKSLAEEYGDDTDGSYRFLKQYLTLNKTELFFADKAILIEGDTERILLPAMMKKADQENADNPLLSQYISIVEVGAYSKVFEKFIDFVGIKTLIITDIDSYYEEIKQEENSTAEKPKEKKETIKCPANDPKVKYTSNNSLNFFHGKTKEDGIQYFIELKYEAKALVKQEGCWSPDKDGQLFIAYQTEENGYHARSFEDSFFHLNKGFITDDANQFASLTCTWVNKLKQDLSGSEFYETVEKAVGKKPPLAIEILLNSKNDEQENHFSNWETPHYIKEGLEWLRKN